MIFRLDPDIVGFPDPRLGEPDGFFAYGGAINREWLLLAYSNGIFPWFSFRDYDEPLWCCPMRRFVIFPAEIHVSHSMRALIRKQQYQFTINKAFDRVIKGCAHAQGRYEQEGAWLGPDIIRAYTGLHHEGYAASVEVWNAAHELVGGLYGVTIGSFFIGESMFSLAPSASKLAMIVLARYMERMGLTLIDCQIETPHLRSMGGRYISYDHYMALLNGKDAAED